MDQTTLTSKDTLTTTTAALTANNFLPEVIADKEEALERVKALIPAGASVINGSSTTLQQIGYIDYLKTGTHGWNNLQDQIVAETDPAKQGMLRKSAVADYYLGSVHALTENGELVIASAAGSQLPHLAFTAQNLILVVSTQKITPTLTEALARIDNHVLPLEEARMIAAHGYGTSHAKTLILHKEMAAMGRKVHILLVEEKLGF